MKSHPSCFVSYAYVDREFVQRDIVPILENIGIRVWIDYEQVEAGYFIADSILKGIRQADFVVAVFNRRSTYMNYEVGAAIGQSKPTLGIVRDDQAIPDDISHMPFIRCSEHQLKDFRVRLRTAIHILLDHVIDKSAFQFAQGQKVIGIRVGSDLVDLEQELRFTADFISLLKTISGATEVTLLETSHGSLKSLISIDFKSLAQFLEKLVFFIPEWKRRKAETLKITAETAKIMAETHNIDVGSRIAEERLMIEQAEAMANLLLKYKDLGVKIQIDHDLMLTLTPSGRLLIQEPKNVEEISDR